MTGDHGNAETLRRNEKFLTLIFGPDFRSAHVCGVAGDPSKKESGPWSGGSADRLLARIGGGTNNYFSVSLFNGPLRRINTFNRLVCFAVDDVGPKLDPALVELLLGSPTWIVETSRGNFQWGFKLEHPLTDAGQATALIHNVRVLLTGDDGKDPGMENITRYVRLPTGVNLKASLGAPWRVLLKKMDPSIGLRSNTITRLLNGAGPVGQGDNGDEFGLAAPSSQPGAILRPLSSNQINNPRGNLHSDDAILKSLRKLGLVLGPPRDTAMGWGFDVRCPWVDEHTDRAETGTVYVAGAGKFKCQHGHCADRTVEDVRVRIDVMLRDNGHKGGLICEEFDEIDVKDVPAPPQGTKPKIEMEFFERFVVLVGQNKFYDLHLGNTPTVAELDAMWTRRLINVLPRITTGKVTKPIPPSRWLREDKRGRKVNGLISWPGMPRVVAGDLDEPDALFVNIWKPRARPLAKAAASEVDARAIALWLRVFWHLVGMDTAAQWEIGEALLDWMALALGDQSLKPGWQVMIMGRQGVGKDTLILPVAVTLGAQWAQTIQSQQIGADFNEWAGRRLVQISETRQNTRGSITAHDTMAILKAIFDNSRTWITVNPKYLPKHTARNVVMGWFTSNEREPLRLDDDDRRFLVLDRNETYPLSPQVYEAVHAWLTTSANGATGIERVAEYLYRRWDNMDAARRKALFGRAPMTLDKQALIDRLKDPVVDWMERCIALDAMDPLTFPDIVTAGYVHSRLFTAIKTGGEGLPGGVGIPGLNSIVLSLKAAGAVVLHDGKQVRWNGSPVVLWAVRDHAKYKVLDLNGLMAQMRRLSAINSGTSSGTIN